MGLTERVAYGHISLPCVKHTASGRELSLALCDSLEGRGQLQEAGDTRVLVADPRCRVAEPTQYYKAITLQSKINKKEGIYCLIC